MGRIRVCQLITELRPAGAERCVYELATRIDRDRFDVQVAALRGGDVADRLRDAGVKVTVLGLRGKWDLAKAAGLVRLLGRERIDLLHTHLFHADLAGRLAAVAAGTPHLVHSVHIAEARYRPWRFAFARLLAWRCDRIVCVSAGVARHHSRKSGLPPSRYEVIYNGIDADALTRDETARRELRRQWGVGDGQVVAVFAGRLDPQKGLDTLLRAIELLTRQGDIRFVIAGDGPQRAMVEAFCAGESGGAVRMLGFVGDVRGLYSAADLLVMPSRWEGFGLSVAEAMAAGLPVVASRVAGLDEVVADGRTGILLPPNDADALARTIRQLAGDADLRRAMGLAGACRVRQQFTIEANVAAHERLYWGIVNGSGFPKMP